MTDDSLRDLVGYERRLWKMPRKDLLAEAERVGITVVSGDRFEQIVARILAKQGIDDELLK